MGKQTTGGMHGKINRMDDYMEDRREGSKVEMLMARGAKSRAKKVVAKKAKAAGRSKK